MAAQSARSSSHKPTLRRSKETCAAVTTACGTHGLILLGRPHTDIRRLLPHVVPYPAGDGGG
eukprot:1892493-Prymnesium_polylepis.1